MCAGFLDGTRMRVIGVITDRDVTVRAVAKGLDLEGTTAAMVMTSPAITCLASADLREAERLMAEGRKSRIAVVDVEGALVGVVSLADLVEHAPRGSAWKTLQAVLWREALGARGGAPVAAPDSNPSGSLGEETPFFSTPAKWNRAERSPRESSRLRGG